MDIDVATLRLSFMLVSVTMLVLFYFVTYRSTRSSYCGWWCAALLLFLGGSTAYLLDGTGHQWWANPLGSGLLVLGAASTWAGARTLRGASTTLWQLLAGPVVVVLYAFTDDPGTNEWAGGWLFLLMMSAMLLLSASELWRAAPGSRSLTTALATAAGLSGGFYVFRFAVYLVTGPDGDFFTTYAGSELTTLINMALLVTVSYSMTALSNIQSTSELLRRATHDGLTNLLNRNEFLARADVELRHARRTGAPCTLVLADLDHFKHVNDTYGHQVGDRVLESFAAVCAATVRSSDLVSRYGGEEYAMLLRGSDADAALGVTSQIGLAMAQVHVVEGLRSSASFGIAAADPQTSIAELIAAADVALYEAKANGRDQAVIARQAPPQDQPVPD